ncbi:MAG: hypothetical protein HDQ88_05040 [Clostridia bacterium]|nr:hypothetical protein [Clostridia bacterium]
MKIITNDDGFWDLDRIVRVQLDTIAGQDMLSIKFTDGTARTIKLTPEEMHATLVRTLASETRRRIYDDDCEGCTDHVCDKDPKRCRFWPRDESEYRHEGCYRKNGHPVPTCQACPRYEKKFQVCMCEIHPCAMCED